MMEQQPHNVYSIKRSDLSLTLNKVQTQPLKVAFLGNSVTAQREGYRISLGEKIDEVTGQKNRFINAGIGGIGSLASAFFVDDFVLRYHPEFCFVECTVADIGWATPDQYITSSLAGIIQKLSSNGITICLLHLYNSHTSRDRIEHIIYLYESLAEKYQVTSININKAIDLLIQNGSYTSEDIVYDGIHSTKLGSQITSDLIFSALEEISLQENSTPVKQDINREFGAPFCYTQIILPSQDLLDFPHAYRERRFKNIIKYLEIEADNSLNFSTSEGRVIGLCIIADHESGVVVIETTSEHHYFQTYDEWCDKERIQAILFEKPVKINTLVRISLTTNDSADRGANGRPNYNKRIGKSLKIVGLMIILEEDPKIKVKLW